MGSILEFFSAFFWYLILCLLPVTWFAVFIHYLYSLPMRRRERALFFLDLIETSLANNQNVEHSILSAAETRDKIMGVKFFSVAACIENGLSLPEALEKETGFLSPQVSKILKAGERVGDLKKVLSACRETLRNDSDSVRSAFHYMVALLLVFSPLAAAIVLWLSVFIIPKMQEVAAGMNAELLTITTFVFLHSKGIVIFEFTVFLLLALAAKIFVAGPGLIHWFQFREFPVIDWIVWRIPWKQKRLQRTFSAMVAVLLDGGVPEADAVRLAGDCTANEICRRRAQRAVAALQSGAKLTEAVRVMDDAGEFQWRLTNATHGRGGFLKALHGWHEALDAKAFQQEEATAHTVTSGLVILNGVVVALIATAMFGILIAILNATLAAT